MVRTALSSTNTNTRLFNYALCRQVNYGLEVDTWLEMATPLPVPLLQALIKLTTRFLF
jgi:hypothetical protein